MTTFPHLPPGREPGSQSLRSRAHSSFWWPVAAVVGSGMMLAGVFAAAGGRGSAFDRVEEAAGGTVFALVGLLCLLGALVMRRKVVGGPRLRGANVAVDRGEVRRGDELAVTLVLSGRRGVRGSLEVGLVCVERVDQQVRVHNRGASTVVREIAEAAVHERWQRAEARAGEQPFTFRVPPDAPYSYEGECVCYAWRVSIRAVRKLRRDPRVDHPIWVSW